ncbi:MAG: HAD hydrolase-like protein [Rhodobacteraceae bacterium]|nr:HAD hydrolase-like protein [Paracoccaceae bacterium]
MPDFKIDTDWAFAQYERVRDVLPSAEFPATSELINHLGDLADRFDVFLLDAFGVLNVGETPIAGAPERIAALQAMGKLAIVMTNGASLPAKTSLAKYKRFGFDFTAQTVIASREILSASIAAQPKITWGVMSLKPSRLDQFPAPLLDLGDDQTLYDKVGGFILLGSADWTDTRQNMMVESLLKNPRPILVGNPDIVAPREDGLSLEPGWFAHETARATGIAPIFSGKPFDAIFAEARRRIPDTIPNHRIAMVGDTLHTDILGGKAAGFGTVLIVDHGLFAGKDVDSYIQASGIVPDFIAPTT